MNRLALVLGCIALSGCLNLDVPAPEDHPSNPATETFASVTGVDITKMTKLPSGVYYQDLEVGTGELMAEKRIANVMYVAFLTNGFVWERVASPRSVDLRTVAIVGFSDGMLGMRLGGLRKIVVPSAQGFGKIPIPAIGVPGNSTLIYDVQLISF